MGEEDAAEEGWGDVVVAAVIVDDDVAIVGFDTNDVAVAIYHCSLAWREQRVDAMRVAIVCTSY